MMAERDIENMCLELLDESAEDALKSEAFTKITRSTVKRILKRDSLNVEELDIYKACVRWAEAECNRQMIEVRSQQHVSNI